MSLPILRLVKFVCHQSQSNVNALALWTRKNKMKINIKKSKDMVLSKKTATFATRLSMEGMPLEKAQKMIHLGVWITSDLTWQKHISEICKRAYARVKMLTKLKYVGIEEEDLIEIYCLMIRSLTEYCSTLFHSSLRKKLSNKIEAIQKTCLKVILGVMYVS